MTARKEKKEELEQTYETISKEFKEKAKVHEMAKFEYEEKDRIHQEKLNSGDTVKIKVEELDAKIEKTETDKAHYLKKKKEFELKLDAAKANEERKLKDVEGALETARGRGGEELHPKASPERIEKELKNLEQSMKLDETNLEPFDYVCKQFTQHHNAYKAALALVKSIKDNIKKLDVVLVNRQKGFHEIRNIVGNRAQMAFSHNLATRRFMGTITISHKERTAEIHMNPDGNSNSKARSLKTLSGGEKSFATTALLLSLWNSMSPPFRLMDEFDVFMDMINRRVALNQIIDYAKGMRKYQYIFLTPLNVDNIEIDEDIKVTRLEKT